MQVCLVTRQSSGPVPKAYTVQVSTQGPDHWTDVAWGANERAGKLELSFSPVSARFVRLLATDTYDQGRYMLGVAEIEALEKGVAFESSELDSLAVGKVVACSSELPTNPAAWAVNGHGISRWRREASDPQWLSVDLGATYRLSRVRLFSSQNHAEWKIEVSSDRNIWSSPPIRVTDFRTTGGDMRVFSDVSVPSVVHARHVRFVGTKRFEQDWGHAIYELLVFGD